MLRVTLDRFAQSEDGTIGRLYVPGLEELKTLEEEDRGNERGESRIPPGTYVCRRTVYHRHGIKTFEVTGVPGRSRILFHTGNTEEDTQGCILVGLRVGPLAVLDEETGERRQKIAVLNSKPAFDRFMAALEDVDEFELEVLDNARDI